MFETDRNQPIRVWAVAPGFSIRTLGMANGTLMTPMPSSKGASFFAAALKMETMVGATLRCSHATGLPCPSTRSEEHTSELQSRSDLVCRLLLEKKKKNKHVRSEARTDQYPDIRVGYLQDGANSL